MGKRGWILAVILAGLMVVGVGGGVILAHGGVKGIGGFGKGAVEGMSLTERVMVREPSRSFWMEEAVG